MARRSTTRPRRPSDARSRTTVPPFQPHGDQVLIRMYGQGVGDCFLLAFPRRRADGEAAPAAPTRPVYVLIDCGVVGGTPDGPQRMQQIVADIKATTLDPTIQDATGTPKGHLDLLILTHEHWDHLSGFVQAQDLWQQIQVDALWTAWTEKDDPSGLPGALQKIREKHRQALAEAADRALRFGLSARHDTLVGLMAFLSDAATTGLAFAAAPGVGEAFKAAKALAPQHQSYCEPGEVRRLPGTETLAYVLGPPRSDARLRQMRPTRQASETYEHAQADEAQGPQRPSTRNSQNGAGVADLDASLSLQRMAEGRSAFNAIAMALLGPTMPIANGMPRDAEDEDAAPHATAAASPDGLDLPEEQDLYDRSFPFDRSLRIALPVAEAEVVHAPDAYPSLAAYFDEVNHWRRIDFEWLASTEAFALQADHLTNNTSLVLAFELPPAQAQGERKMLLFVGDAQVGNWLSWDDIPAWQPEPGVRASQAKPDMADLLRRTVFYKVGHHGSHNATLKAKGVERMRSDGMLTAFVSVSPEVARHLKDWCQMPLDMLLHALSERTGGRVVLPNGNVWPPVAPEQIAETRATLKLEVAPVLLSPKVRGRDNQEIEGAVPLWVQLAVEY